MEELLKLLIQKQWSIGSCESVTAGLFCSKLAEVPNVSSVLKGGIITYQSSVKTDLVKVDETLIDTYGVISEQCALAMAKNTKKLLNCDVCVSFSGNAGPAVMEDKAVGTICCGVVTPNWDVSFTLQLNGTRNEIRVQAVSEMCNYLKKVL